MNHTLYILYLQNQHLCFLNILLLSIPLYYLNYFDKGYEKESFESILANNIKYFGSIEKYFHNLIEINETNKHDACKVINYIWASYFSIVKAILDQNDEYKNCDDIYSFYRRH